MAGEIKEKVIGLRVDSETEKYLDLAVRHDYLLFKDKGLKRENLSEWVRFLINSRINQIIGTKKGG